MIDETGGRAALQDYFAAVRQFRDEFEDLSMRIDTISLDMEAVLRRFNRTTEDISKTLHRREPQN